MKWLTGLMVCLTCSLVSAQTLYWRGGTGAWNNSTLWSIVPSGLPCFCVPTANDNVIINEIPGGVPEEVTIPNDYDAVAKSVTVQANTTLRVGSSVASLFPASLTIEDPAARGVDIYGVVRVFGDLLIRDAPGSGIFVRASGFLDIRGAGSVDIRRDNNVQNNGIFSRGEILIRRNNLNQPGTLTIVDISGHGIEHKSATGRVTNRGSILIDKLNSNNKHGLLIETDAIVFNDTAGVMMIKNVNGNDGIGINNFSEFINAGQLNIDNTADFGIRNVDLFSNHGTGVLNISNTNNPALTISSNFQNYGEINITHFTSGIQLSNNAIFNNWGGAEVNIFGSGMTSGFIINPGTLNNRVNAKINIQDITDASSFVGIRSFGNVNNDGDIVIRNLDGWGIRGINSNNLFNTGTIDIASCYIGMDTEGMITNQGLIEIDSCRDTHLALRALSIYSNVNTTRLNFMANSMASDEAIRLDNATLNNSGNALFSITNMFASDENILEAINGSTINNNANFSILNGNGQGCFLNASIFNNNGNLNIQFITDNGFVGQGPLGALNNNGVITFLDIDLTSILISDGFEIDNRDEIKSTNSQNGIRSNNQCILINNVGASILVEDFVDTAVVVGAVCSLTNDESIILHNDINLTEGKVGIFNRGSIQNNANLELKGILNSPGYGILNWSDINNVGEIQVDSTNRSAFLQTSTGNLVNEQSGSLLSNTAITDAHYFVFGNLTNWGTIRAIHGSGMINNGTFLNKTSGSIIINTIDDDETAFDNRNIFENQGCGEAVFVGDIQHFTGFRNEGYLRFDGPGLNQQGIIENTGLIEDRQGALALSYQNFNTNINNNGIIIHPLYGLHVIGVWSSGILLNGNGFDTGNQMYVDSMFTASAGTYIGNKWLPNGFVGLDAVWLLIEDFCNKDYRVKLTIPETLEGNCPSIAPVATLKDESNWFNPFYWDKNQVPTYCFDVVIPSGMNPLIPVSQTGYGHLIDVQLGAGLNVQGALEIIGN